MIQWPNLELMESKGNFGKSPSDPLFDEIISNQFKGMLFLHNTKESLITPPEGIRNEGDQLDLELQDVGIVDDDAMSIIEVDNRLDIDNHAGQENKEVGKSNIVEAIPLNSDELHETVEPTTDPTVSMWVRKNILKLGKEFRIHFNGCEKIAEEMLMKIHGKRQNSIEAVNALISITPKVKGSKELKNLESGTKFFSYGTTSGGGGMQYQFSS